MSEEALRIDLRPDFLEIVRGILYRFVPNQKVLVFGSRATWTADEYSDLDLAILSDESLSLQLMSSLMEEFRESDLPFKVDIVDWARIDSEFRSVIDRSGVELLPSELSNNETEKLDSNRVSSTDCANKLTVLELGDCIELNEKTYSSKDEWNFVNYLDTGSIFENRISKIQHISIGRDKLPTRARKKAQEGDIVYSTVRPNKRHFGLLKEIPKNFLVSTGFSVFRGKPNLAHTGFIFWYLTQDEIVEYLHTIAEHSTSAYPSIRTADIESLRINLPSISIQQDIARILDSLDDKIESNQRMNKKLEAIARTIFWDWFIEFGPTRAKCEGSRTPYLASEIWKLFPDEISNGRLPTGWKINEVGNSFNLNMGQSPSGNTYNDIGEGLPMYQGRAEFGFRFPENRRFCTAPTKVALSDDTLVSVRAPVGDVNMAWEQCCIGRGVASLRHKSGARSFTYYSVLELQQELHQFEHTGTVFGAITKKQFQSLRVIEPTSDIVVKFEEIVGPLDDRIRMNEHEIRTLTRIRDNLLPKLISGEIRIREAERTVGAVI